MEAAEEIKYLRAINAALLAAGEAACNAIVNHHAAGVRVAGTICEFCHGELDRLSAAVAKAKEG